MLQSWQKFFDWQCFSIPTNANNITERLEMNIRGWMENYILASAFFVFGLSFLSALVRHDVWSILILVAAAGGAVYARKDLFKDNFLPLVGAGSYLLSFITCRFRVILFILLNGVLVAAHAATRKPTLLAKGKTVFAHVQ